MNGLQAIKGREVARPLKILSSLIKSDLEQAERAGKDFYLAAGEKLNEAKQGHFEGDTSGFYRWAEKEFGKSHGQIRTWMGFARATLDKPFKSLKEYKRDKGYVHETTRVFRDWTAPVDAVAERARKEAFRLVQEDALTRSQERDAERALAFRLIDIGYKVLAKELHPDKVGGSRDAMKRLNHVRDKLKHSI